MNLQEIKIKVESLAKIIDAPKDLLPTYGTPRGDGHPYIQCDYLVYHLIYEERGQEIDRKTAFNINDLLFWVFEGVTYVMAKNFELRNRHPNKDFRRMLFKKQIELMGEISKEFADRIKNKIDKILSVSPYNDQLS